MPNPTTGAKDGTLVCISQVAPGGVLPLPGRPPPPPKVLNKIDPSDGQLAPPHFALGSAGTWQDSGYKCGSEYFSTGGLMGTLSPDNVPNPYRDLLGEIPSGEPAIIPAPCGYYRNAWACPASSSSPGP